MAWKIGACVQPLTPNASYVTPADKSTRVESTNTAEAGIKRSLPIFAWRSHAITSPDRDAYGGNGEETPRQILTRTKRNEGAGFRATSSCVLRAAAIADARAISAAISGRHVNLSTCCALNANSCEKCPWSSRIFLHHFIESRDIVSKRISCQPYFV